MTHLSSCPACNGFVPPTFDTCPHCSAAVQSAPPSKSQASKRGPTGRLLRNALTLVSGGAMSMTLMACYGQPPCDGDAGDCLVNDAGDTCADEDVDADEDGFSSACGDVDCDDKDSTVYPGASDALGDGIDQNCDGVDGIALPGDAGVADAGGDAGL